MRTPPTCRYYSVAGTRKFGEVAYIYAWGRSGLLRLNWEDSTGEPITRLRRHSRATMGNSYCQARLRNTFNCEDSNSEKPNDFGYLQLDNISYNLDGLLCGHTCIVLCDNYVTFM